MGTAGGNWRGKCLAIVVAWCAAAVPLSAEGLTVATYNLENYLSTDRVIDGEYRPDYPKPEEAKAALRRVIRRMNADVLALQEIGGWPYLRELQKDLEREGSTYPHAELLEAHDPDRRIAVLARLPLRAVRRHADLEFSYFGVRASSKRGMLEVRLGKEDSEWSLFVLHLKSRYTDRSDDALSAVFRSSEATAARDRVLALYPRPAESKFLIVGDFNDTPRSRPLRALARRGKTVIAHVLPATDSRGETWTHAFRRDDSYSRVDYVLVSPGLKPAVVGQAAQVLDGPDTALASDHRPVLVRLEMGADKLLRVEP